VADAGFAAECGRNVRKMLVFQPHPGGHIVGGCQQHAAAADDAEAQKAVLLHCGRQETAQVCAQDDAAQRLGALATFCDDRGEVRRHLADERPVGEHRGGVAFALEPEFQRRYVGVEDRHQILRKLRL